MTDREILIKAVEEAVEHGYDPSRKLHTFEAPLDLIFSHDFAKAFWGVKRHSSATCNVCDSFIGQEDVDLCWQWNLQQMVLEDDPIKYLSKFI